MKVSDRSNQHDAVVHPQRPRRDYTGTVAAKVLDRHGFEIRRNTYALKLRGEIDAASTFPSSS
jgi:hypothetical protein